MEDWRLTNQIDYLFRKKIKRSSINDYPEKDHEHCSFCWEKFGRGNNMLHEGYCTEDLSDWICDDCFLDFKDMFEWDVVN